MFWNISCQPHRESGEVSQILSIPVVHRKNRLKPITIVKTNSEVSSYRNICIIYNGTNARPALEDSGSESCFLNKHPARRTNMFRVGESSCGLCLTQQDPFIIALDEDNVRSTCHWTPRSRNSVVSSTASGSRLSPCLLPPRGGGDTAWTAGLTF